MKNYLLILAIAACTAGCISSQPALAQRRVVVVAVAPPAPRVERVVVRRGYVWTPGYHRWNGRSYVWVGGRHVRPHRGRTVFVQGHWDARPNGYVWVPGHWR